jgi:hypothetical protein
MIANNILTSKNNLLQASRVGAKCREGVDLALGVDLAPHLSPTLAVILCRDAGCRRLEYATLKMSDNVILCFWDLIDRSGEFMKRISLHVLLFRDRLLANDNEKTGH